jgi:hypothetical protein
MTLTGQAGLCPGRVAPCAHREPEITTQGSAAQALPTSPGADNLLYILTFAFVIVGMYVVLGLLRAAARFIILAAAGAAFWYVHTQIAAGEVTTAWGAIKTAMVAGAVAGAACSPLLPFVDTGPRGGRAKPEREAREAAVQPPAADATPIEPERAP